MRLIKQSPRHHTDNQAHPVHKIPGFTIVELLIVIVVIGILAAISIVSYNGIQGRANDTAIKSDLKNLVTQFEVFQIDNGIYPDTDAHLESLNTSISKSAYLTNGTVINLVTCRNADNTEYAIGAVSKSGKRFGTVTGSSVKEYTGSADWTGGAVATAASSVCSSLHPDTTYIVTGAGYGNGSWRSWTNR